MKLETVRLPGQRWTFRAYLGDVELTVVRGLDGAPGTPPGKAVYLLYGPPDVPIPIPAAPRIVGDVPPHAHFSFLLRTDPYGVKRFALPRRLDQALN